MMNITFCPICNKRLLKIGLRNHIIGTGKFEASKCLWNMLICSKNKPYKFSPMVLRRQAKHLDYMLKNYKLSKKKLEI